MLEIGGKRLPFLRWSVLRMLFGMRRLMRDWQVGDGREEALARIDRALARAGSALGKGNAALARADSSEA